MTEWIQILLPFFLIASRVMAFFSVLPLFAWTMLPRRVRLSISLLVTIFFASLLPRAQLSPADYTWLGAALLVGREVLCGLALGMMARLVFMAVQQGAMIGTQQMGFADAGIFDPSTGEGTRPIALLFQMVFAVLFLSINGHHLLLMTVYRSYDAFPAGQPAEVALLTQGVIEAGATMLLFALKLAAPLLAGFLLLAVIMGVIARVMPEMNILMASMPLRVVVGMGLSLLVLGTLNSFVVRLTDWLDQFFILA
ncbi:MAG: hypothetical protein DRP83_02265 [Planctomycetota bacterium]|nr:MAG: hypothetical protein DRP83_02265 [Planctomycetota bacterium]